MSRARPPAAASTALSFALAAALVAASSPAAQASDCQDIQKLLTDRKSIVEQINGLGGKNKQIDPAAACTVFTKLAANGTALMNFIDTNKDWCQIPEQFAEGIKTDHGRSSGIRGQACKAAAQKAKMMKMAREQQAQGGGGPGGPGGLLGGPGLTGQFKVPAGAL